MPANAAPATAGCGSLCSGEPGQAEGQARAALHAQAAAVANSARVVRTITM